MEPKLRSLALYWKILKQQHRNVKFTLDFEDAETLPFLDLKLKNRLIVH